MSVCKQAMAARRRAVRDPRYTKQKAKDAGARKRRLEERVRLENLMRHRKSLAKRR